MNIGLVAHDTKKMLMQNFCIAYRGILARNELYATGTTGRLIEEVTNLNNRMPSQLSAYVMHIIFRSQQTWQQQNF